MGFAGVAAVPALEALALPNKEGAEEVAVVDGAAGVVVLAPPKSEVVVPVLGAAEPKRPPGCELEVAVSGALPPKRPPAFVVVGAAPAAGVVEAAPEDAGLAPNNPPEAGCVLAPPNKPPLEAGCEPLPPPNKPPPLLAAGAAAAGVLEAGAAGVIPPKSGFCSAGLEAVFPNKPPPPVAGVVEVLLALPKEKVGVPVAWPNRLVVGAAVGVDDEPKRPPEAGAVEVAELLA